MATRSVTSRETTRADAIAPSPAISGMARDSKRRRPAGVLSSNSTVIGRPLAKTCPRVRCQSARYSAEDPNSPIRRPVTSAGESPVATANAGLAYR